MFVWSLPNERDSLVSWPLYLSLVSLSLSLLAMGKRSKKRIRNQELIDILPPFNNKEALTVVRLDDNGTLGIVNAETFGVWVEKDLNYARVPNWRSLPRVSIPDIPKHYGRWTTKWIGGVSKTVRRIGALRAKTKLKGAVTLFATKMHQLDTVSNALEELYDIVTVGDAETIDDPAYGNIAEVIVHKATFVDYIAARIARTGAEVIFEDHNNNALQSIGVERLDRIDASVCKTDAEDERDHPEEFGLGRGDENWLFPWLPKEWSCAPITWDYMVANMSHVDDVASLPLPLRQHVARSRYDAMTDKACPEAEALKPFIFNKSDDLKRRMVSAGLSPAQSMQLIRAFYILTVERVEDEELVHAASLIMYRYMVEQGYTGRWMGKYQQEARFIGNGETTRAFHRLWQYDPHRLPTSVLNKLVERSGIVKSRGNKGSRSKYVSKEERYIPKTRIVRGARDQRKMRMLSDE